MIEKLKPGLRNRAQRVDVVHPNGTTRPVLGHAYPQQDNRRKAVLQGWGGEGHAARPQALASIEQALPQRSQTILSYRVNPELRQRLNGGLGPVAHSRKPDPHPETADLAVQQVESDQT